MGKGGGGTNSTVTQQSAPPPEVMAQYQNLTSQANAQAAQPLQQYSGPMVAGFTPQQQNAFNTIQGAQGMTQPYTNYASNLINQSSQPVYVPGAMNGQQVQQTLGGGQGQMNQGFNTISQGAGYAAAAPGMSAPSVAQGQGMMGQATQAAGQGASSGMGMIGSGLGISGAGTNAGVGAMNNAFAGSQAGTAQGENMLAGGANMAGSAPAVASGYVNQGLGLMGQGAGMIGNTGGYLGAAMNSAQYNPNNLNAYMSPYTQDVVNATQAQFNNQNAQQQQQVIGNAVSSGAWGGDRSAVAQALTAGQQQLAQAPVIAGLENTGYQSAQNLMEQYAGLGAQTGLGAANANTQAGLGLTQTGSAAANAGLGLGNLTTSAGQAVGQMGAQTGQLAQGLGAQGINMGNQEAALYQGLGNQNIGAGVDAANIGNNLANTYNTSGMNIANTGLQQGNQAIASGQAQTAAGQAQGQIGQGNVALGENQQQQVTGANEASNWIGQTGATNMNAIGNSAYQNALSGANANLQAGALQQQLAQEQLNIPYQQFQQQQAFPYQQLNWLTGISSGLGGQSGGSSSTTYPGASLGSQLGGLGMAGLGAYGAYQGMSSRGGRIHRDMGGGLSIPNLPGVPMIDPRGPAYGGGALQLSGPSLPEYGASAVPTYTPTTSGGGMHIPSGGGSSTTTAPGTSTQAQLMGDISKVPTLYKGAKALGAQFKSTAPSDVGGQAHMSMEPTAGNGIDMNPIQPVSVESLPASSGTVSSGLGTQADLTATGTPFNASAVGNSAGMTAANNAGLNAGFAAPGADGTYALSAADTAGASAIPDAAAGVGALTDAAGTAVEGLAAPVAETAAVDTAGVADAAASSSILDSIGSAAMDLLALFNRGGRVGRAEGGRVGYDYGGSVGGKGGYGGSPYGNQQGGGGKGGYGGQQQQMGGGGKGGYGGAQPSAITGASLPSGQYGPVVTNQASFAPNQQGSGFNGIADAASGSFVGPQQQQMGTNGTALNFNSVGGGSAMPSQQGSGGKGGYGYSPPQQQMGGGKGGYNSPAPQQQMGGGGKGGYGGQQNYGGNVFSNIGGYGGGSVAPMQQGGKGAYGGAQMQPNYYNPVQQAAPWANSNIYNPMPGTYSSGGGKGGYGGNVNTSPISNYSPPNPNNAPYTSYTPPVPIVNANTTTTTDLTGGGGGGNQSNRGGRIHRDAGGSIVETAGAMTAGVPSAVGATPMAQSLLAQYQNLPQEKLQEMAVRVPASTAQGQMVRQVLASKFMGAPQQQPQAGLGAPNPQVMGLGAPNAGFARGGRTGLDDGGEAGPYTGGVPVNPDQWLDLGHQIANADYSPGPTVHASGNMLGGMSQTYPIIDKIKNMFSSGASDQQDQAGVTAARQSDKRAPNTNVIVNSDTGHTAVMPSTPPTIATATPPEPFSPGTGAVTDLLAGKDRNAAGLVRATPFNPSAPPSPELKTPDVTIASPPIAGMKPPMPVQKTSPGVTDTNAPPAPPPPPAKSGFAPADATALTGMRDSAAQAYLDSLGPIPTHGAPDRDAQQSKFDKALNSPWMALVNAGLATAAGRSPSGLTNLAQGLQSGVKTLGDQKTAADQKAQQDFENSNKDFDAKVRAKNLSLAAGQSAVDIQTKSDAARQQQEDREAQIAHQNAQEAETERYHNLDIGLRNRIENNAESYDPVYGTVNGVPGMYTPDEKTGAFPNGFKLPEPSSAGTKQTKEKGDHVNADGSITGADGITRYPDPKNPLHFKPRVFDDASGNGVQPLNKTIIIPNPVAKLDPAAGSWQHNTDGSKWKYVGPNKALQGVYDASGNKVS